MANTARKLTNSVADRTEAITAASLPHGPRLRPGVEARAARRGFLGAGILRLAGLGKQVSQDLTAIHIRLDGVALVRVSRPTGQLPLVTACDFRPAADAEELARVLQRMAADLDLKRARCTTVLEPGEYTLLLTEAPSVPKDELRAAVRWRIKDLIDFPLDDATVDVFDAPTGSGGPAARAINVVAARNGAIRRIADLCNEAGINLDVVDIPELAQRNLAALLAEDQLGLALLVFEADHGLITITRNGELYMSRRIEIGTETLRSASNPAPYFEQITLEVQRSLDYFDSHFRAAPVTNIMVAPAAQLPGLVDYLGANLSLRVGEVRLSEQLAGDPSDLALVEERCLTALGAALREEEPGA
jgi:MSHA biogenesis protein MshI